MSALAWLEGLSPWPREGFGLDRMRALLETLGSPQRGLPAVHVVGTNGKSTTTRMIEELLRDAGLRVGAYLSPHVRSWAERVRVDGAEADLEPVLAAVRRAAERLEATQFEVLTAAAFVAFREAGVESAVVEAGLGGRHDATNLLLPAGRVQDRAQERRTEDAGHEHADRLARRIGRESFRRDRICGSGRDRRTPVERRKGEAPIDSSAGGR